MRVAVASKNSVQISIFVELLEPVFGPITVFGQNEIDNGGFSRSDAHVLFIDYSDGSIMENEVVLEMIDKNEPKIILSEKNLYPLPHDERLAWRNRTVDEVVKLLPDYADEIHHAEATLSTNDIWLIGSSSGGPDALTKLFSNLPRLPISFFIAQHIGSDTGSAALQKVLSDRQGTWKIEIAADGIPLRPGYAYIVQRETSVSIDGDRLAVKPYVLPNMPSPCINATVRSLRRTITGNLGVVIMTGLGDDGTAALKEIKHKTLMVLAQEGDDCAARSMPDSARQANVVDESHTAIGLARRISKHYGVGML